MGYITVFVTCPDKDVGKKIAKSLVENKLAACVNIIDGLSSVYYWQGKIEEDNEVLLIIKTREDHYEKLEKFIKEHHPYTVPEIIAMPVIKGSQDYLNWIDETLSR
ncbi:divalent-cation tolerance protein CutA [Persephonella atlantica]|uniref:Divalent-cation tolerance protein CutA n=1 Tax=Persephonella atlantica TaxID=2699429 RepID=A0ABS1GI48_9AQUI|nr:divalent-cation tolerance protein CutA [Persephonella atlantica]MBK3332587.1 divalent-cation tolerance protein CutA [Persephonella atlantica]